MALIPNIYFFQIWTLFTNVVMLTRTPQLNPTAEHLRTQMLLHYLLPWNKTKVIQSVSPVGSSRNVIV